MYFTLVNWQNQYFQFAVAQKATEALDDTYGQTFSAGNWCQAMCEYAICSLAYLHELDSTLFDFNDNNNLRKSRS